MNCQEANKIRIIDFMEKISFIPVKMNNTEAWYLSPLRTENTASFKVNIDKNIWYDHGDGKGGNLIDLVCRLNSCTINETLKILQSFSFSSAQRIAGERKNKADSHNEIISVRPIKRIDLIQYLYKRKIPLYIAQDYLKEIHYKNHAGNFWALGYKNDAGGYELRSDSYKGCIHPKTIITIQGDDKQINIFEGFMDFLSALANYKTRHLKFKTIVLNSTNQWKKIIPLIEKYSVLNLFLDNDSNGMETRDNIMKEYPNANDISMKLYPNYKDFNDWITGKIKT